MPPLPGFHLSQTNLQDFVDCRRRFQLRYLQQIAWPALEVEPALEYEREMQCGAAFHHLAHQYFLGLPVKRLSAMIRDQQLADWWNNLLSFIPPPPDAPIEGQPHLRLYPELTLTAPLGPYRLIAKYDLVALPSDKSQGKCFTIFDWKTSRSRPSRKWLTARLQTRLYPYLLVRAGSSLNQGSEPVQPSQIEMIYWFASFPKQPERFTYDEKQYRLDEEYLLSLANLLQRLDEEDYTLTPNEHHCRFCVYRSLCERGIAAAHLEENLELADLPPLDLDFEQIAEIAYETGDVTLD